MSINIPSPETVNPEEISKVTLRSGTKEMRLSFYTPDPMARKAVDDLEEAAKKVSPEEFDNFLTDFEEDRDMQAQDSLDRNGVIVAAKIEIFEDGTRNHYHYHQGEPYNLYDLAQSYTFNDLGDLGASIKLIEYELDENSDEDHARFVHVYQYHQTKHDLKKEIDKQTDSVPFLSRMALQYMGLN